MRSRTTLFLAGAILSALMIPVANSAHEDIAYVPWVVCITYVVLFAASVLETWDRKRR